jgi:hypothetical protein
MSDFLAIAGVTLVLRWTLQNALASSGLDTVLGQTPTVTALPPDRVVVGDNETPQLNLFMYHAGLNQGWRNAELPERNASGALLSAPTLALDLQYMLSAYGPHDLDAEILLGWAVQILHEQPVLTRDIVQASLTAARGAAGASSQTQATGLTTLADQVELVKLTPQPLTAEEINRLWTAFQAHYRATASYLASVVLIRRQRATTVNLPVQTRNILVQPMEQPVIDDVAPAMVAVGEVLTLRGRHFVGESVSDTTVTFDGTTSVVPDLVQDRFIRVAIPATLMAGIRMVQISRAVRFGAPTDPHAGTQSNPATFMLLPGIVTPPATIARGANLSLTINPAVGRRQRAALLIGSQSIELEPRPLSAPATTTTLVFPIPADSTPAPAPGLPLRVRIDGAESRVTLNNALIPPAYVPRIAVTP